MRVRDAVYDALRAAGLAEPDVPGAQMHSTFMLCFAVSESSGRFSVGRDQLDADLDWFTRHLFRSIAVDIETPSGTPHTAPGSP
jgi:hypothetical protein